MDFCRHAVVGTRAGSDIRIAARTGVRSVFFVRTARSDLLPGRDSRIFRNRGHGTADGVEDRGVAGRNPQDLLVSGIRFQQLLEEGAAALEPLVAPAELVGQRLGVLLVLLRFAAGVDESRPLVVAFPAAEKIQDRVGVLVPVFRDQLVVIRLLTRSAAVGAFSARSFHCLTRGRTDLSVRSVQVDFGTVRSARLDLLFVPPRRDVVGAGALRELPAVCLVRAKEQGDTVVGLRDQEGDRSCLDPHGTAATDAVSDRDIVGLIVRVLGRDSIDSLLQSGSEFSRFGMEPAFQVLPRDGVGKGFRHSIQVRA